ncbi:MAG: tagatose 1,6-diphosphate aldolase [Candidatus Acidiferrum sp.]
MLLGITEGKEQGLRAVADSRGVIAALAIDQRSALRKLFAKAMNVEAGLVPTEALVQFKEAVSRVLTRHASAILLDPEVGLQAVRQKAKSAGLLLAYEKTGYDKKAPGRLPELLDYWSVGRLVAAGANAIKILLYYSSTSDVEINDRKHTFVERVGAECAGADVPFFLELVAYGEGMDDKGAEFARIKPEVVAHGMEEFSRPPYRVDVLKVGVPVNMMFVEGSPNAGKQILHRRSEAIAHYRRAASAARTPFIYLSEGVSNETFQYALELAAQAGVNFSGVLCGRATWQDGVPVFVEKGAKALDEWLLREGVKNIENVNRCLTPARPWFSVLAERDTAHPPRKKGKGRP